MEKITKEELLKAKIPGEETGIQVKTGFCGFCGGDCLLDFYIKDGKIIKTEGNCTLPGANGRVCVKGAAIKQALYNPDRILYPMKRVGKRGEGKFERISWEEALDTIAEKMQSVKEAYGPEQTMVYVGHPKWFRPQITEFVKIIRGINPKPVAEYAADESYMECEVEVLKENESLTVKMLNNYEALQLRPEYYMTTDETMTEFVKPYLKRIRLLVDTLNARERTLFSIVSNITEHQRNFFLKDGRLEPFTLKEVAEELGMHESTISRAISNKSVRFKNREIPLKYFFISKTVNGDSKDCVEERIKALIASEDKQHPLSDQKLSELMKKEGIVAARRTIAKYREQMGILPAAKRKVY